MQPKLKNGIRNHIRRQGYEKGKRIIIIQAIIVTVVLVLSGCADPENGGDTSARGIQNENRGREEEAGTESTEPSKAEAAEEYASKEEIEALGIPEDMLAYWMVLNSKKPFVSTDEGGRSFTGTNTAGIYMRW